MVEMLKAKKDELTYDIKDAYYHIDKAVREEKLFKMNLIPKAKEAVDVAKTGYRTGEVSFLDALDADMTWLNFNIEYYKAIRHKAVSIAEMERLTGLSLSPSK